MRGIEYPTAAHLTISKAAVRMEGSNYSRPKIVRPELEFDKFTIKKDPNVKLVEVIYSKHPCAKCGGKITEREVYEQKIYVTGCKLRSKLNGSAGQNRGNLIESPSSEFSADQCDKNEISPATVGSEIKETASDPEVLKRVRRDRGDRKGQQRRKRQAEARSRKIAGVTKKVSYFKSFYEL